MSLAEAALVVADYSGSMGSGVNGNRPTWLGTGVMWEELRTGCHPLSHMGRLVTGLPWGSIVGQQQTAPAGSEEWTIGCHWRHAVRDEDAWDTSCSHKDRSHRP